MTPSKKFLVLFCILALGIVACGASIDLGNWPGVSSPAPKLSAQDNVSTMVAQTLQALTEDALTAAALKASEATPTATPTNTPATMAVLPTLSVSMPTNCYAGPSTKYGFVITIYPGDTVTVVGKDVPDNYWIINAPGYPGTVCWLSGQYASVTGDTADLPSPVRPVGSTYTLDEPRNLRVSCSSDSNDEPVGSSPPFSGEFVSWWHDGEEWTVEFRWTNTDPDQTGLRIFRNGWQLATLGGHVSSYTDTFFNHHHHEDVTYGVQAFNYKNEVSSIVTIDVRHCN